MNEYDYSAMLFRTLRERTGLTQAEFGHRIGFDPADVSKYEHGRHSMTLDRFAKACDCLGYQLNFDLRPKV